MEDDIKALPGMIQNFRIRSDLRAREVFRTNENVLIVILKKSRVRLKVAATSSISTESVSQLGLITNGTPALGDEVVTFPRERGVESETASDV
ncbi:hypothetical protein N7455_011891 [Penicillium solitum]|uniref:uncharacterized protein n=1 Tax=Penicillium solitum TaxID=60172 RepID=UPI0017AB12BF|nr:hypothetical protein HAV15_012679 [Penicillium sp. str. \